MSSDKWKCPGIIWRSPRLEQDLGVVRLLVEVCRDVWLLGEQAIVIPQHEHFHASQSILWLEVMEREPPYLGRRITEHTVKHGQVCDALWLLMLLQVWCGPGICSPSCQGTVLVKIYCQIRSLVPDPSCDADIEVEIAEADGPRARVRRCLVRAMKVVEPHSRNCEVFRPRCNDSMWTSLIKQHLSVCRPPNYESSRNLCHAIRCSVCH